MIGGRRPALYLDTARSLTPRQLLGRLRRPLPPSLLAAGLDSWDPPPPRLVAAGMGCRRAPQSGPVQPPHEDGVFRAVGHSRAAAAPNFWSDPEDGLLFLFHVHGFEPLARYAAGDRSGGGDEFWAETVRSWLRGHERPAMPAWHPYPTSNRVIAWSSALSSLHDWPADLRLHVGREILRQARYLSRAVEHDIGGNHVIRNGFALVVAGGLFPGSGLLKRGLGVLRREAARQVLGDGGHAERSTSYHLEVLEDLDGAAELLERVEMAVPDWLADARGRMHGWRAQMRGPDLRLPLLNDAWEEPAGGARDGAAAAALADSGYWVVREGADQLVFDAGPLSAPDLPPHAHADALSFVLWADGEQVVVDPGTYAYTGPRRGEFRATRAHNTVEVDGHDQCVFWGDFRLAFAPQVRGHPPRRENGVLVLSGSHDGYSRLASPVRHCRNIVWWPPHGVVVVDLLAGDGRHRVRSSLHLAPGTAPGRAGPLGIEPLSGGMKVERLTRRYSPYLGAEVEAPVLEGTLDLEPGVPFGWSLLRPSGEVLSTARDRLTLRAEGETLTVPLSWDR